MFRGFRVRGVGFRVSRLVLWAVPPSPLPLPPPPLLYHRVPPGLLPLSHFSVTIMSKLSHRPLRFSSPSSRDASCIFDAPAVDSLTKPTGLFYCRPRSLSARCPASGSYSTAESLPDGDHHRLIINNCRFQSLSLQEELIHPRGSRRRPLHQPPLHKPMSNIRWFSFCAMTVFMIICAFPASSFGQQLSDDGLFYCSMPESNLAVSFCGGDYPSRTAASLGPPTDKLYSELDKKAADATRALVETFGCAEEQCKVRSAFAIHSCARIIPALEAVFSPLPNNKLFCAGYDVRCSFPSLRPVVKVRHQIPLLHGLVPSCNEFRSPDRALIRFVQIRVSCLRIHLRRVCCDMYRQGDG